MDETMSGEPMALKITNEKKWKIEVSLKEK